jgi:glycogen synthase
MGVDGSAANAPAAHRVLMTADTVGGVWQYALELCRGLTRRGDSVALATMGREPDREQRREADAVDGLTLYPSRYRLLWMDDPWLDVQRAGEWLRALEAELRPSVVHLNDFGHGMLPWHAPVLLVAHSCVLSWWQAVHGGAASADWTRYEDTVRQGIHAADLVVAPTRAMLDAICRHYGQPRSMRVIGNGRRAPQAAAQREPLILSAGRLWDPAKNIEALVAVAPRLAWPVCIAGERTHPDGRGETRIGQAPPNVRLLGRLASAQLQHWHGRASIYALPARYEPFGLSALEAALSGCALVLGDIPSLREVWGDAALFVPPDDHDALAHALQRLIADDILRAQYGARARSRAHRYPVEAMVDAYRQAYAGIGSAERCRSGIAEQQPRPAEALP